MDHAASHKPVPHGSSARVQDQANQYGMEQGPSYKLLVSTSKQLLPSGSKGGAGAYSDFLSGEDLRGYKIEPASPYGSTQLALDALSFLCGDVMALVAAVSVYCVSSVENNGLGFSPSVVGLVIMMMGVHNTIGGPIFGTWIDNTIYKREVLAGALGFIALSWCGVIVGKTPAVIGIMMGLNGLVTSILPPAMNAISLGVVGHDRLVARCSRNEMWKHVGAAIYATLSFVLVGGSGEDGDGAAYNAYFGTIVACSLLALLLTFCIRPSDIDHTLARGAKPEEQDDDLNHGVSVVKVLMRKDVILVYIAVCTYHLSNAAMLPQMAYKLELLNNEQDGEVHWTGAPKYPDGVHGLSLAVIVGQIVMIGAAKASGYLASVPWCDARRALLGAYICLPIRGVIFGCSHNSYLIIFMGAILDGIAGGAIGVLGILLVMDLAHGTGHTSVMQGLLATMIGLGSALSHVIAGVISDKAGVDTTMYCLASLSAFGLTALFFVAEQTPNEHGKVSASCSRLSQLHNPVSKTGALNNSSKDIASKP